LSRHSYMTNSRLSHISMVAISRSDQAGLQKSSLKKLVTRRTVRRNRDLTTPIEFHRDQQSMGQILTSCIWNTLVRTADDSLCSLHSSMMRKDLNDHRRAILGLKCHILYAPVEVLRSRLANNTREADTVYTCWRIGTGY